MSTQIAQTPRATTVPVSAPETALAPLAYICQVCHWAYDPAMGDPEHGIAPGTAFEDIPDDWYCPDCGVTKTDFTVHEF